MDDPLDEALLNMVPMPADEVRGDFSDTYTPVEDSLDQALLDMVPISVPDF